MERRSNNSYEEGEDFNYWPSFSDMMLSIVLILVVIMFLSSVYLSKGMVDPKEMIKKEKAVIYNIAKLCKSKAICTKTNGDTESEYEISDQGITIKNDLGLQRITFADNILFDKNESTIHLRGQEILLKIGSAFKERIDDIMQIQIQGHADTDRARYGTNMSLAAKRAIAVFDFLKDDLSINPAEHFMSATSYGEYMPVCRKYDEQFNDERLKNCNSNENLKSKNRRIEILLFYKK